jgi:hypothetical protein
MNWFHEKKSQTITCIVAHDAGGAEVLASYVARNGLACRFVLVGPAIRVFERRLGLVVSMSLEAALAECDDVLCGTSWQSDLEWTAIAAARAAGKPSTAFIDHWGHYRERFIRQGVECLPDEIWVGDSLAETLARTCFPAVKISLVPNPYFEDIRDQVSALQSAAVPVVEASGLCVLFVCEPLSEHGLREFGNERHWGYTEFDALRYFFANMHVLGQNITRFVIRPHPSEPEGKYLEIVREFGEMVRIGGGETLLAEVVACDVVVGCESMAMVVGLLAGRRVISCIPPGGKACELPQAEIESMQKLLKQE